MPSVKRARTVAPVAGFVAVLLAIGPAQAASRQWIAARSTAVPTMDRLRAAALLPRHIATTKLRADRTGDTAASARYFKITNLSAEAGSTTGYATAINNAEEIAYVDEGESSPDGQQPDVPAYLLRSGYATSLFFPVSVGDAPEFETPTAINENGEVVGDWGYSLYGNLAYQSNIAWTQYGAVAYWDGGHDGAYASSVNDRNIAVGYELGPVAFEGATSPPGRRLSLKGMKGRACDYRFSEANAINDADEIVGTACGVAVRWLTLTSYAQAIPSLVAGSSTATAMNAKGDIFGSVGKLAFVYHAGRVTYLSPPPGKPSHVFPVAINSSDQVLGMYWRDDNSSSPPFLSIGGHAQLVNALLPPSSGWTIVSVSGMNDRGDIVGAGYYNGNLYGVLLEPPSK